MVVARRRHDRRLGPPARLLRVGRGRRRVRGRADPHPAAPDGGVQLARVVQRGLRGAARSARPASSSRSTTRWSRSSTGTPRGPDLPRRLRLGHQPLEHPRLDGAAVQGRHRVRARSRSCAAPTRGRARSSPAARRAARPRWSCSTSTIPDIREFIWCKAKEEDKAAALRDAGFDMSIDGDGFHLDPVPERQQLRPPHRRVHARRRERRGLAPDRPHDRRAGRRADPRARADARDRRGGVALRRSGRPVRHDDQPVAHVAELGPHQRVQPVLGVHARRRLGVQPRVAEPHEVPPAGRHARRRDVQPHGRHRVPGAGDHRRPVELPDRGDRPQRPRVPPARPRLRQPRRLPDGQRPGLRLRRRPRLRGGDHRADDRPRLPAVGEDRRRRSARTTRYAENREAHNNVMRMHRDASYAIPDATCEDDALLAAARETLERGGRARRALRLPQRAGDGARAHGDDLVPDGLRHDGHRARLLARQVQGARRRRHDDDRQPHGADGAAHARLRRRSRSSRSRRTSTSTARSSARPAWPRSTCRCSTSRSARARSRTWATSR